ncbi:unnamed protein product [Cyprideis torosa]|uniref:Striatin N-terminal domain-containing protein n=1 Tax=Cyprideis torosa TaxID=163714 RepID=A0A7R8WRA3_9CRUS|nr:unnamed protein product [Cyprideis torosa]CAG0902416.1 unnamed protein product [Cyprideis torosa]
MVESARADEDMRQTAAGDVQDGGNPNNPGGGESEEHAKRPGVDYSVPAVLHFIQHEWARTEKERAQWETEKAELQPNGHRESETK